LILFSAYVLYTGTRSAIPYKSVNLIIALDCLWVIASVILIAFQMFSLAAVGYIAIGAVAVWVAAMAVLQFKEVRIKVKS